MPRKIKLSDPLFRISNINGAVDLIVDGDLTTNGDLIVNGTQTNVNSVDLNITDNTILLNKDESGAGVTIGTAGIEIERGTLDNVLIRWNESTDEWEVSEDGATFYKLLHSGNATTSDIPYNVSLFAHELILAPMNGDIVLDSFMSSDAATLSGTGYAYAKTAPTAPTSYVINRIRAGVSVNVCTVDFSAGSQNGTFSFTSNLDVFPGDVIEFVNPTSPDPDIKNVSIGLSGVSNISHDISFFIHELIMSPMNGDLVMDSYMASDASTITGTAHGYARTAPTAATSYTVNRIRSGVSATVCTVDFAAGSQNATFAFTSNTDVIAGDIIEVVNPTSPDPDIKNVSIGLDIVIS